jgi:hypothetical protein
MCMCGLEVKGAGQHSQQLGLLTHASTCTWSSVALIYVMSLNVLLECVTRLLWLAGDVSAAASGAERGV